MSTIVERILNEIQEGSVTVESDDDYRISHFPRLPNCPCFVEDAIIFCLERYDPAAWSG